MDKQKLKKKLVNSNQSVMLTTFISQVLLKQITLKKKMVNVFGLLGFHTTIPIPEKMKKLN